MCTGMVFQQHSLGKSPKVTSRIRQGAPKGPATPLWPESDHSMARPGLGPNKPPRIHVSCRSLVWVRSRLQGAIGRPFCEDDLLGFGRIWGSPWAHPISSLVPKNGGPERKSKIAAFWLERRQTSAGLVWRGLEHARRQALGVARRIRRSTAPTRHRA